ncbi:Uncharacterised nucleotidyltransferase [Marisediminitalea aggregata]|uniref:Uncharacterized nucleotidyltransferase n=1 Tax=Marisediminitalea aggregata TaxID=634436 RepID=A0A1M5HFD3_9ALTE|nr:nucleotidyltransferase family protein [Marisediminitalea aggregata]SHG14637.1 Uncharacterised nucleotidyltransferase [Marisediminitalea aggregata]
MLLSKQQLDLANIINQKIINESIAKASVEAMIENGICSLVLQNNNVQKIPSNKLDFLRKIDRNLQIIHNLQLNCLKDVFLTLNNEHITFIVLKGWALSYEIYSQPHHRPKTDIDIFIEANSKERVKAILQNLGFSNPRGWEPEAIIKQFTMRKDIVRNVYVSIDIHLEISDDKNIQRSLTWKLIYSGSKVNETINVRFPNRTTLLTHAIFHLLHHRAGGDFVKLIWLYDINLLIQKMTDNESNSFIKLIEHLGFVVPVRFLLSDISSIFPNKRSRLLLERMKELPQINNYDYLINPPSIFKHQLRKLQQAKGIREKITIIKETLFPPKEEIYRKYGRLKTIYLPYWYIIRIIHGLMKYIKNNKS